MYQKFLKLWAKPTLTYSEDQNFHTDQQILFIDKEMN